MNPEIEPPEVSGELEGRYANYFKVGHNALEFLLDFGQFYAESQRAQFHTRIITNPTYAKAFLYGFWLSTMHKSANLGGDLVPP
jgi:hypothetical protein